MSASERDKSIVRDRLAGMQYRELEAKYGIDRVRCRQICKAAGLPNRDHRDPVMRKSDKRFLKKTRS